MRRTPSGRPTVEIVIRRAPMPSPSAAVACANAGSSRSRLASGSPMPITTTWLRRSSGRSSRWSCNICSRISPRGEVADDAVEAAGAEGAVHRAADLRADANRAMPAVVAQEHALDPLPVAEFQEKLLRAVGGLAMGGDPGGPNLEIFGQLLPQRLGQVAHLRRSRRPVSRTATAAPGRVDTPASHGRPARRAALRRIVRERGARKGLGIGD